MGIIILVLSIVFIIYSLYDLKKDRSLSKRIKVNWTFIILLFPVTGSLIYYWVKMYKKEKNKCISC